MHKVFRFIYLNTYSFLVLICGISIVFIPVFKISKFILIPQIIVSLYLISQSIKLFSTWNDKKIKYRILMERNRISFRPDTFKAFMQAPCGRLLSKAVLKDLGLRERYSELLIYKQNSLVSIKEGCTTQETIIRTGESYK